MSDGPELIPVAVSPKVTSHKPSGRLPLLSARPAVTSDITVTVVLSSSIVSKCVAVDSLLDTVLQLFRQQKLNRLNMYGQHFVKSENL